MSSEKMGQVADSFLSKTIAPEADQKTEQKQQKRKVILNRIIYPISALVALPTSILSGFAALESEHGNLKSLDSLNAIGYLLMNQSIGQLFYGLICLLATAIVLTGLNKKYLLGSTQTVLELIKSDLIYLKNKFSRKLDGNRISLIENGLFIWCFITSLIFAELGKETMAFLGIPGEIIGFYLNLIVYFATRYAGARRFFRNLLEQNNTPSSFDAKSSSKDHLIGKIVLVTGYMLAFVSAISIIINFIPECVKGLQMLLHSNLNADPKYQNMTALSVGLIATLPTVFFYSVSIKDLPKHLAKAALLFYEKIKSRHYKHALLLSLMTVLAFAASYFAGIGFRLVGTSNIEQGYLSYLNPVITSWMPNTLFIACIMMFWSHLQHLINERVKQQ
ncbi:Uncharacterised protein [Legionella steigerwaltii]|uniref:Uncharacterized protein n=1 Tax=Legionella steigerwaltii TaxID=460 RepID=A0A378L9Y7_9GAMM|nr:hypothetical protein [Legionella steigerwaltii]KTD77457.1 hypothetical protein Lstg_1814 [Legionella steigerwaltii]STY22688.1 Uncharacterised protein [Legionella steigerwaltii]